MPSARCRFENVLSAASFTIRKTFHEKSTTAMQMLSRLEKVFNSEMRWIKTFENGNDWCWPHRRPNYIFEMFGLIATWNLFLLKLSSKNISAFTWFKANLKICIYITFTWRHFLGLKLRLSMKASLFVYKVFDFFIFDLISFEAFWLKSPMEIGPSDLITATFDMDCNAIWNHLDSTAIKH